MTADCCAVQLIDGKGKFNVEGLESFMNAWNLADGGPSYGVVSILGPQSSGKSTLLNHLFRTNFKEMDAAEGRNKAGRYVAIIEYGEGRRRGSIMVPEGLKGRGWSTMADCFHDVVAFLSNARRAKFSSNAAEWQGGVSFADAVKKVPLVMIPGKVVSKGEGRSTVAGGKAVSSSHAKEDEHGKLAIVSSGSKAGAFNESATGWCEDDYYCVRHLHTRLAALKMEMDRLLISLDMLGQQGTKDLGRNCKDCGVMSLGPVGSSDRVEGVSRPGYIGGTDLGLGVSSGPVPLIEGSLGPGSFSLRSVLSVDYVENSYCVKDLNVHGSSDPAFLKEAQADRSSSFCSVNPTPNYQNLEVGSTSTLSVLAVGIASESPTSEEGPDGGLSASPLPFEPDFVAAMPPPLLSIAVQSSATVGEASTTPPLESSPSYELDRMFEEAGVNGPVSGESFEFIHGDIVLTGDGEDVLSRAVVVCPEEPLSSSVGITAGVGLDTNARDSVPSPLLSTTV
ncbi:Protein ROOT HAIR DEFECTIVE 3 [Morella rubra]|uniref:Protein ROOT HAIR DEFECTIVE 3 n=1 Tax=Morella rubra TaxID=262757 RepID=A0A6A1VBI9_9ROSI|nr:Protein ROOT HAIR DEFECTIVE 3 [Morella rubra]